jgi:APA family basic amino acid/polyamine antiporter
VTKLGLPPEKGGFENDPVLGLVEHLGLHGTVLSVSKVYVGLLAATILFIATNAGVIGASRITYSMASYRQLPEIFRRLHPRFKTPWLALLVFAGAMSIIVLLPGQVNFLGTMYSFGAMLSFTIAHASVIALRRKRQTDAPEYRIGPNLRVGNLDLPLFAVFGGLGTAIAWLVVVIQYPPARWAGLAWLAIGFLFYWQYRRRVGLSLLETVRAPALVVGPSLTIEYRTIVAPVIRTGETEEALVAAARLAAERGATVAVVTVIEVPLALPLDAELPDDEDAAEELLDDAQALVESYGVRAVTRLVRARKAGPAIVDDARRRSAELIVLGAPRRAVGGRRRLFGGTVDYVLREAPCRVLIAAGAGEAAA